METKDKPERALTPAEMLTPPVLGAVDSEPRMSGAVRRALVPDDQMFPCLGNLALAKLAYTRYMTTDETADEVAKFVGVPAVTAQRWAALYDWASDRAALMKVRERDERHAVTMLRLAKRKAALEGQLEAGKKLREAVKDELDQNAGLTPSNLKLLGDALRAASDVEGRGLGVSADGASGREDANENTLQGGPGGKAPLVVVVQGGGLPNVRISARPEPVTITQDDAENPA
jgi:hypothetical protein